jgi:exodeoxyribonuclease VIII
MWGNGATFDISMLEDAYRQYEIEIPWKFWNVRDCRTVLDMYESIRGGFNKTVNRQGAHNALDDAKFQAQYITMMWSRLLGDKK